MTANELGAIEQRHLMACGTGSDVAALIAEVRRLQLLWTTAEHLAAELPAAAPGTFRGFDFGAHPRQAVVGGADKGG